MTPNRGESDFVNLPAFAARLYDSMMHGTATQMQYREIARDLCARIPSCKLLDVGTGPGHLLKEIHALNPQIELYGLDISSAMRQQAQQNLTGIPVDLQRGNITATDYPDITFDCVICSGSFYLWDQPVEGLNEIRRILKPDRKAYLYETHRDIDAQELKRKMKKNLQHDELIRKLLAPRFFLKQIAMTYSIEEIEDIIKQTAFGQDYSIEKISIFHLPVWVRVELGKG